MLGDGQAQRSRSRNRQEHDHIEAFHGGGLLRGIRGRFGQRLDRVLGVDVTPLQIALDRTQGAGQVRRDHGDRLLAQLRHLLEHHFALRDCPG